MLDKIKTWFKGVFGIKRSELEQMGQEHLVSEKMWEAMQLWHKVFYDTPPWAKKKTSLTKFSGILTNYAATLATNEIEISCGEGERAEYIKNQIQRFFLSDVHNTVQKAAAFGCVVIKPSVCGSNIYADVVPATAFFPTRMRGGIVESAFFTDSRTVKGEDYIRIEAHELTETGITITNKAYKASVLSKGREIPLATVPAWADLQEETTIVGVTQPMFAVLQMPLTNRADDQSELPVSLFAGAIDSLRELDRIYSEFLWEIQTGKRKQILDISAVNPYNQDSGLSKEEHEQRVKQYAVSDQYLMLEMGFENKKPYDDYTPELRVDAYQSAMDLQLRLIENQCGLSPGTFSFDIRTGTHKTATEIISEDKSTYNTIKQIQEAGLRKGIEDLISVYDVYAELYGLAPKGPVEASVSFGDSIFEDTNTEFMRRKSLADSGYIRKESVVAWYFSISEEEAAKLLPEPQKGLFDE